jgi:hypothetical protein
MPETAIRIHYGALSTAERALIHPTTINHINAHLQPFSSFNGHPPITSAGTIDYHSPGGFSAELFLYRRRRPVSAGQSERGEV